MGKPRDFYGERARLMDRRALLLAEVQSIERAITDITRSETKARNALIREAYERGESLASIAATYRLSEGYVRNILSGMRVPYRRRGALPATGEAQP